ncbi:hypothetical protein [Pigmentiphaga litoralis]|uniref:hypothetical protein n=1 Tax=Pigmentiphaga litoralis TaxID=516702 RepID=UPI0016780C6A|nr:hypothetical protein [Pigmentiphaga litoralis]
MPPHRKAFGTAVNVDNDVLLYTAAEMGEYGLACFKAGRQPPVAVSASSATGMADAIQNDEDRWVDYRSGRASRP